MVHDVMPREENAAAHDPVEVRTGGGALGSGITEGDPDPALSRGQMTEAIMAIAREITQRIPAETIDTISDMERHIGTLLHGDADRQMLLLCELLQ